MAAVTRSSRDRIESLLKDRILVVDGAMGTTLQSCGLTADGSYAGGIVWQKFITRLVLHGPVVPEIPCSLLREGPGDYVVIDPVADDLKIELTA